MLVTTEEGKLRRVFFTAEDYLRKFTSFYPDILEWFWTKVKPGLLDGTRFLGLVCDDNKLPNGIVIAKIEKYRSIKLCTMHVDRDFRGQGIGSYLLSMTIIFARMTGSKTIRFTSSDCLDREICPYFLNRNFWRTGKTFGEYNSGVYEWHWEGCVDEVEKMIPCVQTFETAWVQGGAVWI